MKYCKDCKHCELDDKSSLSRCLHPITKNVKVSIISGEEETAYKTGKNSSKIDYLPFCSSVRSEGYGYCGEAAALFEQK